MMDVSGSDAAKAPSSYTHEVLLHCLSTDTTSTATIAFPTPPATVLGVKKAVQSAHSIPTCVQRLSYESTSLRDGDLLDSSIRSGDTFHVTYKAHGECKDVEDVVAWMRELTAALEGCVSAEVDAVGSLDWLLRRGRLLGYERNLCVGFFMPWCNDVKFVNKLHFVSENGLDVLMKLYALATEQIYSQPNPGLERMCGAPEPMCRYKIIEDMCLLSVTNFCETQELQKLALRYGARERIKQSFLGTWLGGDPRDLAWHRPSETVRRALYSICTYVSVLWQSSVSA